LTDRGTEYCGKAEQHDYQLYLALNDIEHTKTKVQSLQMNGICERFHKTILQEFYQTTLRKKIYRDIESLQKDLNEWIYYYNNERTHPFKSFSFFRLRHTAGGTRLIGQSNLCQTPKSLARCRLPACNHYTNDALGDPKRT